MYTRPLRILLIEDNPHDALRIMKALENQPGCIIRAVEDGEQALACLRKAYNASDHSIPDLILLDLKLPKVSGHELLAEIKTDSSLCQIPILVFSDSGIDHDVNTSYALHANCYIEKPYDPVRFTQVIQQTVDFWLHTVLLPQ